MVVRAHLPMTRAAVESCLRQSIQGGVMLNVIDNASQDCGPYLRSLQGNILLQSYGTPRNLHKLWNQALGLAFGRLGAEHALVVNNDVVLRPDTYRLLVADGSLFVTGIGVGTIEETYRVAPSARSLHPDFSCFLMRKECWERVGPFEECYAIYAGDCAYHVRMHRMGVEARSIDVPFYHVGSGTLKHVDSETRDEIQRIADGDRETFVKRHGCAVGTEAYDALFLPSAFGADAR